MGFKYILGVLAFLAISAQAEQPVEPIGKNLGVTAEVNDYIDHALVSVAQSIRENGLDPMPLPDVEEGFRVKYLLVTYSAQFRMHDGDMTGLVNIQRNGDQTVNYFAKMLRLRVSLQFNNIEFRYRYRVKVMNIGPTGRIYGSISRIRAVVDLLLDFNNDEVHLQEFSLNDIQKLRVRLGGNVLTDWLVNPVIRVFTAIIDDVIMDIVTDNIRSAVQNVCDQINTGVRDMITHFESYN